MPLALTHGPGGGVEADREKLHQAAEALESLIVKQLVKATNAFTGGDGAGSAIRADMFADALADAMVKGGGIGLAAQIERSLAPGEAPAPPSPAALVPASALPARAHPQLPEPTATGAALRVTSPFGPRHDPFDGHLTRHDGVDLAGADGEAIHAVAGGVVRRAGPLGGYGNAVEIDHGGGMTTLYAHASELLVRDGDRVTPGQSIARVGHSGRATGPHLHFEVRQGGKPIDPSRALKIYALRADDDLKSGS
jgi:murein DD-endopeptidase MepM/ murein hydrolase activator NlpD